MLDFCSVSLILAQHGHESQVGDLGRCREIRCVLRERRLEAASRPRWPREHPADGDLP